MEPPIGDTAGRVQIRELDDSRLEQDVRLWESDAEGDAESPFALAEALTVDCLLPVGPPDRIARMGSGERYVAGITDADDDIGVLAERSQVLSAADIEFAARKAAQASLERSLRREHAPARRPAASSPRSTKCVRRSRP